jgi:hypothetical protein
MWRKANAVSDLDGVWNVERTGGLLPPLLGVRKSIGGATGRTTAARSRASSTCWSRTGTDGVDAPSFEGANTDDSGSRR